MINIEHLSMRFGRHEVLSDVNLHVAPGDSIALWGSNGAGKTTILRSVLGLLRFQGEITVGGYSVKRQGKQARRLIGYVPQELVFNDDLRVRDAVELFSTLRGIASASCSEALDRVQLTGHEKKRMRELSGGMKQRLALAIALIGDPQVLVLDEVTASLDAVGRCEFISLLVRQARQEERCLLFASHRVDEIESLATRVLTIGGGKITENLDVPTFSDRFGDSAMLHLTIDQATRDAALRVLQSSGFPTRLNGRGVIVSVPSKRRMEPIHVLLSHQVRVDNFDLLSRDHH